MLGVMIACYFIIMAWSVFETQRRNDPQYFYRQYMHDDEEKQNERSKENS